MLSQFLKNRKCTTYHAKGDANVLFVKTAVESSQERNTVLVGDNTDLLVLLCFYTRPDGYDLYFILEPKANSRRRVWNMKKVKEQLGDDVSHNMLFLHAISFFETGKAAALKKYFHSSYFREQAKLFDLHSILDVMKAGKKALVSLYSGKPDKNLDSMQHQRYLEKLTTKSLQIQPQNLPPTSAEARFHIQRFFFK